MEERKESICRNCFHSYVCEQFNEDKDDNNEKCHFANDHYIPRADVVPKSEVAREIVEKFNTKMHSEIARNELLAEYGDDFYEGRIDASLTAIDRLAEIVMEYSEDKNDT